MTGLNRCTKWMLVIATFLPGSMLLGQQTPGVAVPVLPGRPDENGKRELLNGWFESQAAGIKFRAPANAQEIRRAGVPELVVEFINEKQGMILRVTREELREAMPLMAYKDSTGKQQLGLLQQTIAAFKRENPGSTQLREEIITVADADAGLMVFRFGQGGNKKLLQQAIIPVFDQNKKSTPFNYYLSMTSTSGRNAGVDPAAEDPDERLAVETFNALLDTVKLLDSRAVVQQQEERLFRTRTVLLTLKRNKTLENALVPKQWLRLVRDGRDIGYSYVEEEKTSMEKRDGVLVSVHSRTEPEPGAQVDVLSRMFVALDWRYENWSHVVNTTMGGKTSYTGELGISERTIHRVLVPEEMNPGEKIGDKVDAKQPPVREEEVYRLEVRQATRTTTGKPVVRPLPPWYLPQAIRHLLPRMLPLNEAKSYIFATYVSYTGEVMGRYIDVGKKQEVSFAGSRFVAIPIQDRLTLEGVPTTYYVSPEGKYLGNETVYETGGKRSVIQVIPSSEAELKKLWPNADLTKPTEEGAPASNR